MITTKQTYYTRRSSGSRFWNWTRKTRKRATVLRRMKVEAEIEAEEPTDLVLIGKEPLAQWNYLFLSKSDANSSSHMLEG